MPHLEVAIAHAGLERTYDPVPKPFAGAARLELQHMDHEQEQQSGCDEDAADPGRAPSRSQTRRKACERDWLSRAPKPDNDGRDPVAWLRLSNKGRVPELVPLRHGRMRTDPFAFYRGAAGLMA